jgi:hypothetical protein
LAPVLELGTDAVGCPRCAAVVQTEADPDGGGGLRRGREPMSSPFGSPRAPPPAVQQPLRWPAARRRRGAGCTPPQTPGLRSSTRARHVGHVGHLDADGVTSVAPVAGVARR